MPRKSAASLAVLPPASRIQRAEPPERLNKEEAEVWRTIVGRLPPEWFPAETLPLLEEYCVHVIRSRMIAEWIKGFEAEFLVMADGLERVDKLLAMGEREAQGDGVSGHEDEADAAEPVRSRLWRGRRHGKAVESGDAWKAVA